MARLLHRLWTKAVGTYGYDKSEWKELDRLLESRQPDTEQAKPCEHVRQIRVVADEVGAQLSTINYPVIGAWCADCGALMVRVDNVWNWRLPQAPVRTTEQAIADWLERGGNRHLSPWVRKMLASDIRSGKWREGGERG